MLRDAKVFENSQAVPKPDILEGARDSQRRDPMGPHAPYILVEEPDLTFRWAVEAAHQVKDRRLACPVWTYQTHEFTAFQDKIEIGHRPQAAEKMGQFLYLQKSHASLRMQKTVNRIKNQKLKTGNS
jgi:hypothetical protein